MSDHPCCRFGAKYVEVTVVKYMGKMGVLTVPEIKCRVIRVIGITVVGLTVFHCITPIKSHRKVLMKTCD